ncbi:MAG: hypothetical protein JZU67_04915 [Burkholderiaceae bacterium]|jgi:hypothetical protein|nr:hypothetical protein [Burkholderiaceae bacterium]
MNMRQGAALATLLVLYGNAYAAKGGIGAIFGGLIGGVAGHAIGKSSSQRLTIDDAIVKMASEVNKQLPMTVDRDTRLDSVSPGVGRQFTYNYTFVNSRSQEFDRAAWYREASPLLRNRFCTNSDMEVFFKNGVSVSYSYQGKDGGHVGKVTISPSDCGYKS